MFAHLKLSTKNLVPDKIEKESVFVARLKPQKENTFCGFKKKTPAWNKCWPIIVQTQPCIQVHQTAYYLSSYIQRKSNEQCIDIQQPDYLSPLHYSKTTSLGGPTTCLVRVKYPLSTHTAFHSLTFLREKPVKRKTVQTTQTNTNTLWG